MGIKKYKVVYMYASYPSNTEYTGINDISKAFEIRDKLNSLPRQFCVRYEVMEDK